MPLPLTSFPSLLLTPSSILHCLQQSVASPIFSAQRLVLEQYLYHHLPVHLISPFSRYCSIFPLIANNMILWNMLFQFLVVILAALSEIFLLRQSQLLTRERDLHKRRRKLCNLSCLLRHLTKAMDLNVEKDNCSNGKQRAAIKSTSGGPLLTQ